MNDDSPNWRYEYKYLLPVTAKVALMQQLRPLMKLDQHGDEQGYRVTSLYYDDQEQSAYFDKIDGDSERTKYRWRAYNLQPASLRLEIKIKKNNLVDKKSQSMSVDQFNKSLTGQSFFDEREMTGVEKIFFIKNKTCLFKPQIVIDYQRLALIDEASQTRITFDQNLTFSSQTSNFLTEELNQKLILEPGYDMLEIKYQHFLPNYLQQLLSQSHLWPVAASKYVLAQQRNRQTYQGMKITP